MNTAEMKIEIFKKLDSLKGNRLEEAYGILLNFINRNADLDDWGSLTSEQQDAIKFGVYQLDKEEGRSHNDVMSDIRKRFLNG